MKPKIYIASPYSIGDKIENVNAQIRAANQLMNYGYTPFLPLLSHFQDQLISRPYTDWLENDLEWIAVCDGLLRLPGESPGADIEVKHAMGLKIPIYYSIDELKNHLK